MNPTKNILSGVDLQINDMIIVNNNKYKVSRTNGDYTLISKDEVKFDGEDPLDYVLEWEYHLLKSVDLEMSFVCEVFHEGHDTIFNHLIVGDMEDHLKTVAIFTDVKLIENGK